MGERERGKWEDDYSKDDRGEYCTYVYSPLLPVLPLRAPSTVLSHDVTPTLPMVMALPQCGRTARLRAYTKPLAQPTSTTQPLQWTDNGAAAERALGRASAQPQRGNPCQCLSPREVAVVHPRPRAKGRNVLDDRRGVKRGNGTIGGGMSEVHVPWMRSLRASGDDGGSDVEGGMGERDEGGNGSGIGVDHDRIYPLPLRHADRRYHLCDHYLGSLGVLLIYFLWVLSAFVTFLGDVVSPGSATRRRAVRRSRRMARAASATAAQRGQGRAVRRLAVAPPIVGRSRLRRRWIGSGTWRALRLLRASVMAACEECGTEHACGNLEAPRGSDEPCGNSTAPAARVVGSPLRRPAVRHWARSVLVRPPTQDMRRSWDGWRQGLRRYWSMRCRGRRASMAPTQRDVEVAMVVLLASLLPFVWRPPTPLAGGLCSNMP